MSLFRASNAEHHRAAMEREVDALSEQLAEGRISTAEYNREIRELQRDYAAAAEDAAREAAEMEREQW